LACKQPRLSSTKINRKPFCSKDFRIRLCATSFGVVNCKVCFRRFPNLPGYAFIRFPYFLRSNSVSFRTLRGEVYRAFRSVSICKISNLVII
jgi:hypothetical protein